MSNLRLTSPRYCKLSTFVFSPFRHEDYLTPPVEAIDLLLDMLFIYLDKNTFESVAFFYLAKASIWSIQTTSHTQVIHVHQLQVIQEVFYNTKITQEDDNRNHMFKMVLRACHMRLYTLKKKTISRKG